MLEILLGPIELIRYGYTPETTIFGYVLCLLLIPCILSGMIRPRWWSVALSMLGVMAWLYWGLMGWGILC
jgi:hypothetical protein